MRISKTLIAASALLAISISARAAKPADNDPASKVPDVEGAEVWKDTSQPVDARVQDLVRRLSLTEKASQLQANPPAIPRLGIPAYSHRNECLHGVTGSEATVFPQAIGMAATWDTPLIHEEADAISTEGRAKHNDYVAHHDGNSGEHFGVNFYSPNINIFRDPRWGRGQETYGEDPFLTSRFGVAFITGLQGDDLDHPKAIGCAKHYAVHSGPEGERHRMNMEPSDRDLYETYLPAFEAEVREAHVGSAMGAYSSLNGIPCCADPFLLTDLLRKRWGFVGVIFSDGGAIGDIWATHKFVPGAVEAAAVAVKAGCDVSSGGMELPRRPATGPGHQNAGVKGGRAFSVLPTSVAKGLIDEATVDQAVSRELTLRMKLGLFDGGKSPYVKIGMEQVNSPEHRALAEKVAEESIVLLKNDGLFPLDRTKIKKMLVLGPNADSLLALTGNYAGIPMQPVTIVDGIKALAGDGIEVTFDKGWPLALKKDNSNAPTAEMTQKEVAAAKASDIVVFVGGLDSTLEKEDGNVDFQGFLRGDRTRIELPPVQEELLKSLHETGKPIIFINCTGSAIAMPWENANLNAIVQAWYPGVVGGTAVGKILFGEVNPGGRLPITVYNSTEDLPPFDNYSMANRTYRYFTGKPLYAFGYGLSYTKFDYADAKADAESYPTDQSIKLAFKVTNSGKRDGDEVAQVYFRHEKSAEPQAKLALCGFKRVHIAAGQSADVAVEIPLSRLRYWSTAKTQYVVEPGKYDLQIGGASDDARLHTTIEVTAAVGK